MNDRFAARVGVFLAYAIPAAALLYWFRGHLQWSTLFIAAAIACYGIAAFMSPGFANIAPLGSKQLRGGVMGMGLLFLLLTLLFRI
jgi:hypothetical protein